MSALPLSFLAKATEDCFFYLVVLRGGQVLRCDWLETVRDGWIRLHLAHDAEFAGFPCPRGIDVREFEIVAIADAPSGS